MALLVLIFIALSYVDALKFPGFNLEPPEFCLEKWEADVS